MVGQSIAHYRILEKLGQGGMGEVWKAEDTRLGRTVALKFMKGDFTKRFEREARAVSALNHPNICTLYDVGPNYLVTEFIEGQTLRSALAGGPLPQRKAIDIATQVAEGLGAAHAAGIVHRDLKPENIMVTREGRVKILDFGLARYSGAHAQSETTLTDPGTVLGTTGYMSPEQVRGELADHRSDIFSFGLILHELLTGRRVFQHTSSAETMAAILKDDPPELPATVSPGLTGIVSHCLEKQAGNRFQSAHDLAFGLRALSGWSSVSQREPAVRAPRRLTRWLLPAGGLLAGLTLGALLWLRPDTGESNLRYTPFAMETVDESSPVWSPDGKTVAYVADVNGTLQVFVRRMDSAIPAQLTRQESPCSNPTWAPDGNRIFFVSAGSLRSIGVAGGQSSVVEEKVVLAAIAPDGETVALCRLKDEHVTLWFGRLGSQEWRHYSTAPFLSEFSLASHAVFSPDGSKLAVLLATHVNTDAKEVWVIPSPSGSGAPVRLFRSLSDKEGSPDFRGAGWMPDSRRLVVGVRIPGAEYQLFLCDSGTDRVRQLTTGLDDKAFPAVSPAGDRIAFEMGQRQTDLWEVALGSSFARPVLATVRQETCPAWHPRGNEYAYVTNASGSGEIWSRSVSEGWARPLIARRQAGFPPDLSPSELSYSPDGERLAFTNWGAEHSIYVWRIGGGKPVRLDPEDSDQHDPAWSPDGNWIAYLRRKQQRELVKAPSGGGGPAIVLGEGGRGTVGVSWSPTDQWIAIYDPELRLYSPDGRLHRTLRKQRYNGGGFSRDGKTLFACRRDENRRWIIEALDVASGLGRKLPDLTVPETAELGFFSLHPDGKRFLCALSTPNRDIVLLEGFQPPRSWFTRWWK
jgi:serine/threonine protein kinase/WD40 repeat protein